VFRYSAVLIISALYVASFCNRPLPFLSVLHLEYQYQPLGDIIIIFTIIMNFWSPVTDFFTPVLLLIKPPTLPTTQGSSLSLQYFRIICDVPSTAVFCIESIELFPVLYLYFVLLLFFLSLAKRLLFQRVN
jgi:hypothetical protein